MKHLKLFQLESEYNSYKNGNDYILPNVSYVEETEVVMYNSKSETPIPQMQFPITIISESNNEINEDNIENVKALYQYLEYKLSNAGITADMWDDDTKVLSLDENEQIFITVNAFDLTSEAYSYRYYYSGYWEGNDIEENNGLYILINASFGTAIILPSGKSGVHFT